MRARLIDAYYSPRYHTAKYRQRAITEFENEWHLECTKVLDG